MDYIGFGPLEECPPWAERRTVNGGRSASSRERPCMSPGGLPKAEAVASPVTGPACARVWPFGLAGRGRTRVSEVLRHPEGGQGFPSQEYPARQALRTASGAAEICFSFRIQTIRLERLPFVAPGYCHGNALPSCTGSPRVAATVLGPAKPAGVQVFATAAPIGAYLIIIQFSESSGNNTTPPWQGLFQVHSGCNQLSESGLSGLDDFQDRVNNPANP